MTTPDGRGTLIQLRRDTAADWAAVDPVLAYGEPGWDITNNLLKLGDGATVWSSLPSIGTGAGSFVPVNGTYAAAGTDVLTTKVAADATNRSALNADGSQDYGDGTAAFDVTFGRTAAGILSSTGNLRARTGAATQVTIGNVGPGSEAGITYGSSSDATMYRTASGALRTPGTLTVDGALTTAVDLTARSGAATQVKAGAFGPGGEAGLVLGSAADTVLGYRTAAGVWRTSATSVTFDGAVIITGRLTNTPPVAALTPTTGAVTLDMAAVDGEYLTHALSGNVTYSSSNRAAGRTVTIKITCDGTLRTFTFPAWVFVGGAAPASIAANKRAILTVTFFDTTDAGAIAAYSVEP